MKNNYVSETDRIFFKHEVSEDMPLNTFSAHTHNAYELIYFVDGDATHVIEDRKYKLQKGDLILIHPFRYHFIQIDAPSRYERYDILFHAEKHGVESIGRIQKDMEVIRPGESGIVRDIFQKCDLYYRNSDPDTFERILSHLLSELFYNISLFPHLLPETQAPLSPLLSKALKYTNDNLCTATGIGEIARHLFVSESYLFRLFRQELHQTPKKYILEKRLLLAQKKISAGECPTQACEDCGFGDYTTFYRNYRAFFGQCPSRFATKSKGTD